MSIRTIQASCGPLHYAVCNECKAESERALIEGVAHSEDALNVAFPHGWTHEQARTVGGHAWSRVQLDFCPRCSVAPEYRRQA
jgi:hypothetical protein